MDCGGLLVPLGGGDVHQKAIIWSGRLLSEIGSHKDTRNKINIKTYLNNSNMMLQEKSRQLKSIVVIIMCLGPKADYFLSFSFNCIQSKLAATYLKIKIINSCTD